MPTATPFASRQYMLDSAFEAFYYNTTDVWRVASHTHDYYEIYLFESGDVTYRVGGQQYSLLPGDILLLAPGEPHHPVLNQPHKVYSRLVLWVSKAFIENTRESCGCNFALAFDIAGEHGTHVLRLRPGVWNELFQIVFQMATRPPDPYARALNNISLLDFLVKLNRHYAGYSQAINREDPFAPHLTRAVDYISNNFHRPITLEDVADSCYISKFHLAHEFKRLMGMTVFQYISSRRLYRARQLMLGGEGPAEAARRCGFGDYSAFYRAFRAAYGQSPKFFSQQHAES